MVESGEDGPRGLAARIAGLVFWLVLSFLTATFSTMFGPGEWYATIAKPAWTPPGWVFGPVWTLLYIGMAVSAWLVWLKGGWRGNRFPLVVYVAQLAFNAAWSWLFFGERLIGLALADIVVLWLLIVVALVLFWQRRTLAGTLMLPYALWVGFASALNFQIWRLN